MNKQENLYIQQEQNTYSSQEYKDQVLSATKRLLDLGICDLEWTNVTDGVDLLAEKLRQREIAVYGKERSQEELEHELNAVNQRIANLDQQIIEINQKITDKKIDQAMQFFRKSA